MALSTASFAAVPCGNTLHKFMMPLYSPMLDADLHESTTLLALCCPTLVHTVYEQQRLGRSDTIIHCCRFCYQAISIAHEKVTDSCWF